MDAEEVAQYDEFGNFIGDLGEEEDAAAGAAPPAYDDYADEDEEDGGFADEEAAAAAAAGGMSSALAQRGHASAASAIVLHEDKQYYPDASEVYPGAETLVQDEDTQPLSTPLVAPVANVQFSVLEAEPPTTTYAPEFLTALMSSPALIRNVALVGHLHHGKTSLADVLIEHTHAGGWGERSEHAHARYTDARRDEQARGVSIKATPVSLVLPTGGGKHYLLNLCDTPGHVNFVDETVAALRAADGVLLVVDAVEGVQMVTVKAVRAARAAGLPLVLVISKVDRLILELKLPPADAYFKLAHVIQEVNALLEGEGGVAGAGVDAEERSSAGGLARQAPLSPAAGNVVFAGSAQGWSFTLESFAALYAARSPGGAALDVPAFAARLWGDSYYEPSSRRFRRSAPSPGAPRAFVQFVLEPLYKLYARVVGEEPGALAETLRELRLPVRPSELRADAGALLRMVLSRFLGPPSGLLEACVRHLPSPLQGAAAKCAAAYTGAPGSAAHGAMLACDPAGPLMVNVVKLLATPDGGAFLAWGRVLSGTLRPGASLRVLGEGFLAGEDEEDAAQRLVGSVSLGQARYRTDVSAAPAGCCVLIEGIADVISKSATLTDAPEAGTFAPLAHVGTVCVNVSVEPLNPADLPKVLAGLRALTKSYPLARTRVEESGEHVLSGTGELALDCMLHDLRLMYAGCEVKVADPVTSFAETVADTSSVRCFAHTPNKRNTLTMVAEPLDRGLAEEAEAGGLPAEPRALAAHLAGRYEWDLLASRGVWAFGPAPRRGPNLLLDDTLAGSTDKAALGALRDSIVQGFQWACREGPLCDEPVRGVKFKLLDALVDGLAIHRGGGQVIPTARRVAYSALLLASPRLMEPVYALEALTTPEAVAEVYRVLAPRRGHIVSDAPVPGTPWVLVKGFVPVMDSFGLETDLRVHTQGLAFGMQDFDHWAIVPGDPLDKSIILRPLEPSPPPALAREFMVKTRRRKGLAEDVAIARYLDEEMLLALAKESEAQGRG